MLGRGRHSPVSRKSGTVRLALCASTMSPIGRPSSRAQRQATAWPRLPDGITNDASRPSRLPDLETGRREIGHLRQQAADIDAVGGAERHCVRSDASLKDCLTSRWQSSNVPRTAKLWTLSPQQVSCRSCVRRDLAGGKQQHDAEVRPAMEGRGDRAARVAGSRHQNRQRARIPSRNTREAGGQKSCAEILERRRRAVKQLEHGEPLATAVNRPERRRKVERFVDDRRAAKSAQCIAFEERRQQPRRDRR